MGMGLFKDHKEGARGGRVVHCLLAMGKAYCAKRLSPLYAAQDHCFAPGSRRERVQSLSTK
eukprot:224051-Pyramimonas_sp.AAC.1